MNKCVQNLYIEVRILKNPRQQHRPGKNWQILNPTMDLTIVQKPQNGALHPLTWKWKTLLPCNSSTVHTLICQTYSWYFGWMPLKPYWGNNQYRHLQAAVQTGYVSWQDFYLHTEEKNKTGATWSCMISERRPLYKNYSNTQTHTHSLISNVNT